MKVAIYNPYLYTLGGGEKYSCAIAEALSAEHEVHILSHSPQIARSEIEERLNVDLSKIEIIYLAEFQNNTDRYKIFGVPRVIKYYKGRKEYGSEFQKNYDLLINVTAVKPIFCQVEKGILIVQFPFERMKSDYLNQQNWLKRIPREVYYNFEWNKRLKSYNYIIVYSEFVKKWLKRLWGIDSIVINPPGTLEHIDKEIEKKKLILGVGRFFVGGHSKKQHLMISAFKDIFLNGLEDWELHLIGGVLNNDKDQEYLNKLKMEAQGYPIFFHINISFNELCRYYKQSSIFWHAAGYGENEEEHPEKMEHFGITTVEAMSAECVPVVINRGGQPEIVRNKVDGYLWDSESELKSYTRTLCNNTSLLREMQKRARERSQVFNKEEFRKKVFMLVNELEKTRKNMSERKGDSK